MQKTYSKSIFCDLSNETNGRLVAQAVSERYASKVDTPILQSARSLFMTLLLIHDTRRTKKSFFFTWQKTHSESFFFVIFPMGPIPGL